MRSIERRIYAYRFVDDFILIYPFYALLFEDNGLSTADISLLFFGWGLWGLIAEIPTGVIADRFDRRRVLASGQVLNAAGFLCWFVFPEWWGYLLGFVLWATGEALASGTYEALLYDELKAQGRESAYLRVAGRANGFALVGILFATLVASTVAHPGYEIALLASVAACVLAGIVALSLPAASRQGDVVEFRYREVLAQGVQAVLQSRRLLASVFVAAVAGAAYGSLEEYSGLFISDLGFEPSTVALALVVIGATDALGSFLAEKISGVRTGGVYGLVLLACALLAGAAVLQSKPALVLLGAFYFLTQAATVIADARVQHSIESSHRATVTSVSSFAVEVVGLGVFVLFAVAGADDRFTGFTVCAGVIACLTAGAWIIDRRSRHVDPPT